MERSEERPGLSLPSYLERVHLSSNLDLAPTLNTLTTLMAAHMRSIPFENLDVVLRKRISISLEDVCNKLIQRHRGGYCFEHNTLFLGVLAECGFAVRVLNCRVMWGKSEPTAFSHMAIEVTIGEDKWLADVGFGGSNSIQPICLNSGAGPQRKPDGVFRVRSDPQYSHLEVQDREDASQWRELYCWTDIECVQVDLECGNWYSHTFPGADFMKMMFVSRSTDVGGSVLIVDDQFVKKSEDGTVKERIQDVEHLVDILRVYFELEIAPDSAFEPYLRLD